MIRGFVMSVGVLVLGLGAASPAADAEPVEGARQASLAVVDSLFDAARFDSLETILPGLMDAAIAAGDSVTFARLMCSQGRVMLMRGEYENAERTLDQTIDLARTARDTTNWMNALGFKGFAVTGRGRPEQGETLQRRRLQLALTTKHRRSEAWARTAIAYHAFQRGDSDSAQQEYWRAIALFREDEDPRAELTPLIGISRAYYALGQVDDARAALQRAWSVASDLQDAVQAAYALNNLGVLEAESGDMAMAARYYTAAYEQHLSVGYHRGALTSALNIARSLSYLGRFADCAQVLEEAFATAERMDLVEFNSRLFSELGFVRLAQGRRMQAAAAFRNSLAAGATAGSQAAFWASLGLARALSSLDSLDTAAETLFTAFEAATLQENLRWQASLGAELTTCLRRSGKVAAALDIGLTADAAARQMREGRPDPELLLEIALCYARLNQPSDARAAILIAAEEAERGRDDQGGYEWRETFAQRAGFPLAEAAEVFLGDDTTDDATMIEDAFNMLQRFKARTLMERISEPRGVTPAALDSLTVTLDRVREELLAPGDLLLDFTVGESATLLFAVSRDSCRLVRLEMPRRKLAARVRRFCALMGAPDIRAETSSMARMQRSMGQTLLGEVADLVANSNRLLLVPDAFLSGVPFGVLAIDASGRMLLDTHDVELIPAATLLTLQDQSPRTATTFERKILALAAPDDLPGTAREVAHLRSQYEGVDVTVQQRSAVDAYEVIHIAAHVIVDSERPWQSGIAVDWPRESATTPARSARNILTMEDSLFVSSALADAPVLRAYEITAMTIPARLAVLSGCESAGGRATLGEGVLGLSSSLLSAGVPSVVATLWPVDDNATALFMRAFYAHVASGKTISTALRVTQADIRQRRQTRHPFYWAGFVCIGDGSTTIGLTRRTSRSVVTAVLVGAIIVVTLVWGVRRRRSRSFL